MILGSSECKTCSGFYLASISIFILVGMALVILVTLTNMTVSVGTLNGLIFLANILRSNQAMFLPKTSYDSSASAVIAFMNSFIAWVNLDLGIPMCLFNGLTTYVKTWLQYLFPIYIFTLVGAIIIVSKYSLRVTRLLGTNAVSVLATMILLSYTKILRILITAFSFTMLTGSEGYYSVVWLADGNIKYFESKHAILFTVSVIVLLLFGVPYTVILTTAPWIQRSSFNRVSSLYNRFKPLFDAYMGPYKDNYRYWMGMLLLVRVVVIVLFSSIANTNTGAGDQLNLFLLNVSSTVLLGFTAALRPYKTILLNALEIFHLTILFLFTSSHLYIISYTRKDIGSARTYVYAVLVGICFIVFLGVCAVHIRSIVHKVKAGRRPQSQEREESVERYSLWQNTRIRAEDEEMEEVTITTSEVTNSSPLGERRESLVNLIADCGD